MNFFVYKTAAERYVKYRPYFHPLVIEKIKTNLNLRKPISFAIDVGCGPGQSTVALKEIADFVVGLDVSAEMLGFAEKKPGIDYIRAVAESLAVQENSCDLMITSMAYHWFEPKQFFAEARRVLKTSAWLVIFNNWFQGQMKQEPEFERWARQVHEKHYPTPPRNSMPMTPEFAKQHGFRFPHPEEYQNEVDFRVEELAGYLTTQSNVIAATEQGNEKIEDVYQWLITQTQPFFKAEKAFFPFRGYIWYLQKAD